jgi:hypothetical protein
VSAFPPPTPAAVAALLQSQGIALAPGRAEKICAALAPLIERAGADAALAGFESEPGTYLTVVEAVKSRG